MQIMRLEHEPQLIPIVAGWLYEEWGRHLPDGSVARAERLLRAAPDDRDLPVSLIALHDGAPVGVARLIVDDMETRPDLSPWLASVFVLNEMRGQGIGSTLCHQVTDEARRLGFSSLYLFTPDREAFYARQGWDAMERTVYREKNVVIMRRMLCEG